MGAVKEVFEIDNRRYETRKLNVLQAVPVHAKVMKALGDGLAEGLSSVDIKAGERALVLAIAGSLAKADMETLLDMVPEILGSVFFENERLMAQKIEQHFGDYPQDLYPVFFWTLAVNIAPFLGGGGQGWKSFIQSMGLLSPKDGKTSGPLAAQ
jgi:hypothetical protein